MGIIRNPGLSCREGNNTDELITSSELAIFSFRLLSELITIFRL